MGTFQQQTKRPATSTRSSALGPARIGQSRDAHPVREPGSGADERDARSIGTGSPRRGHDFARIAVTAPKRRALQTKLAISKPGDAYEQEADRVAEQVMRMPAPASALPAGRQVCAGCEQLREDAIRRKPSARPLVHHYLDRSAAWLNRDAAPDEIRERLVNAFLNQQDTLQRQAASPESGEKDNADEEILMQAKRAGAEPAPGADLDAATAALDGNGASLPVPVREDMEARFGHDFSRVRIHADAPAAALARRVNARAFTVGRNLVFANNEYAPHGTPDQRRLLAHELTHVVQQGQAGRRLQRKIEVAGKAYTPSTKYLNWLKTNFGAAMQEFVQHMHNAGKPPVYSFASYQQMGFEVRTRANAIKGIEEVHKGCCEYYDSVHPPYLDSTYWDHIGSGVTFKTKSPLPAGKHVSDAVAAIFAPGAGTRLECLSMTLAIEYYAMLKAIGAAKFNARFASGIEISAAPAARLWTGADKKYKIIAVASKAEILPGDWVYFKNFKDYPTRVPGGYWQGENAIYLGNGKYRGFGVAALSENDLNKELVKKYNTEGTPVLSKTVADLIADGGGLLLSPVARPIIAKIAP